MPYSCKMIPYQGLKIKAEVDVLLEKSDFSLARRIDKPLAESGIDCSCGVPVIPLSAPLLDEFYYRIPSMSMTFVDDEETCEAASYKLCELARDNWNGENIDFSNYENAIEKKGNCFQIIYSAKNLHKREIPYVRKFQKQSEMIECKIQDLFKKDKKYDVKGSIFLEHSPTNLNYRHFELKLQDAQGKIIKSGGISSYPESGKNETSKSGRDCFTRYVLKNFLAKDFTIDKIPEEASCLPESIFFDDSFSDEVREKNRNQTKELFFFVKIEKQ